MMFRALPIEIVSIIPNVVLATAPPFLADKIMPVSESKETLGKMQAMPPKPWLQPQGSDQES